jgi:protein TonB
VGKFGVLSVFVVVFVVHLLALQTYIYKKEHVAKPKAKVHHITLSAVVVKKPVTVPKIEPIILPPDPEPIVEEVKPVVEPIVLPLDPKPVVKPKRVKKKKKHKKRVLKKVVKKPLTIQQPIIEKVPLQPMVQQVVAPIQRVDTASIKDAYTSAIRRQIKLHLYYPKMAKRMRMQGVIKVSFLVLADGSITDIKVISGTKAILRKAAKKTIKSLRLKPLPSVLGDRMRVSVPVGFNIKGL